MIDNMQKKDKTLVRKTFVTSRAMDFFSEKELVTQTGHSVDEWPLVFLKETIDNALDACEETNVCRGRHTTTLRSLGGATHSVEPCL